MSWVNDAFGDWYSTVYPHRDAREAARLVRTLDDEIALAGRRVLDIGCGAGRHLASFRECGAHPVGMDLSPQLLTQARAVRSELSGAWELVRGDMRVLPFGAATFDGATSLFTSFGYFGPLEDQRVVQEWARVLRPGAFHLLDFLNPGVVRAQLQEAGERFSGDWRILETRRIAEDALPARVIKRVRIASRTDTTVLADYEEQVALYELDDLRSLLSAAGFHVRALWGDYDGSAFDAAQSSRLLLLSVREGA